MQTLGSMTDLGIEIPDWLHELKFDGYRILALLKDGKVRLLSRRANDWTARFRPVALASFSSIDDTTNPITDASVSTQWSLSLRCSSFGIRVASWTHTSSSLVAMSTSGAVATR